jgi:hypothetical protein
MPKLKKRVSAIARSKEKQKEGIRVMRIKADQVHGMVRDIKSVMSKTELVGHSRFVWLFDEIFRQIEPNKLKRRKRLSRIFRLQPLLLDLEWVRIIRISYKKIVKISYHNLKYNK